MVKEAGEKTKEIFKIVNGLARLEEKEEKASKLLERNDELIDQKDIYLDTLTRLLADAKDICSAIFFDDHPSSKKQRLLFATNRKVPESAKEFIKKLREFIIISDNIGDSYIEKVAYEELMCISFEKVRTRINWLLSSLRTIPPLNEDEEDLIKKMELFFKNFKTEFEIFKTDEKKRSLWIREKLKLVNSYANLINNQDKRASFENSFVWEALLPIFDTNIIVESIINGSSPIQEIFKVISEGEVKPVINNIEESFVILDTTQKRCSLVCHAEMRILKEIYQIKNSNSMHVGIGMLCCVPCYSMFEVINDERTTNNEINNKLELFTTRGTHGCNFIGWQNPEISEDYSKALIKELQSIQNNRVANEKKRSSTSNFPPQLLTESGQEKYQSYIEQDVCQIS